ncbi:dUTP diphosphatase [Candidatus Woesearchaeota archaeon]|nr:dUTP diphosphatase [Candidatus Woesearchaeota archaeon]
MKLHVQRMDKSIELPNYARDHDAAFDLRAAENCILKPLQHTMVKTGLKMSIPQDHVGLIWDRSGLAAKHAITTMAGVIDAGYRGEICVVMINLGKDDFKIEKGMRIAQMLIQPVLHVPIEEVEELDETLRGEGGFGSTGLH